MLTNVAITAGEAGQIIRDSANAGASAGAGGWVFGAAAGVLIGVGIATQGNEHSRGQDTPYMYDDKSQSGDKSKTGEDGESEGSDKTETTKGNPPLTGKPNSKTDIKDKNGNKIGERYYGPDGRAERDIHTTSHGNSKNHPQVPHGQDWDWSNPNKPTLGPAYPV